MWKAKSVMS
ncbi:5'-nucleotidase, C-terminal domain protein, partial [Vibrio parahaemolyticus V-223/04]